MTEWSKVFKQRTLHEARNDNKLKKTEMMGREPNIDDNGIDYVQKQIDLNDDEFDELLSNFPCEFEYLKSIGCVLLHSPFDKEFVRDVLNRWYFQREHTNESTVDSFVDRYYSYEESNMWFYAIVNKIEDETKRNGWKNRFKYWSVDETIKLDLNLNDDCFTLSNVDLYWYQR